MDPSRTHRRRVAVLDESAGRAAPKALLRRHLASGPAGFLAGAVDNPSLTEPELILLLRNRQAPAALLLSIGRDRRWTAHHRVRRGLVLHPRTPFDLARHLVPSLFWRELAEVAASRQVNPVLRRLAEESLKQRIEEMTPGEQISLARRASRGVVVRLAQSRDARVLRSVLGNPCLLEAEVVGIASGPRVPGDLLAYLAGHGMWGGRRAVRLALVGNRGTPVQVALGALRGLDRRDLQGVREDAKVPRIVRIGADRWLRALPRSVTRPGAPGPDNA